MSPIYKIPGGQYIDLDKLVSISDAYFVDRMGYGGWFVQFEMEFQLRETTVVFERALTDDEYKWDGERHFLRLTSGEWAMYAADKQEIMAVDNLQSVVKEIVRNWKNLKATVI